MTENTGNIGFEETLWKAADKLRGSMDASEYKHVVLGLIFLKYISDKFETKFDALIEEGAGFEEDRDEYEAENIFWVPKEARWGFIKDNAKDPKVGQFIDDAMILIEKENTSLKGVLDKRYARPEIDKRRLGELIDLISTIKLHQNGEKDLLGRVYEYFLGQFASVEGKGGGEFYTPTSVVKTLVDMIEPYQGRVYDPCCGSAGMLISAIAYLQKQKNEWRNVAIYGQEINALTSSIGKMNLFLHGVKDFEIVNGDTLKSPAFIEKGKLKEFDMVLANPPYSISQWDREAFASDKYGRNFLGVPPQGRADYAFLQHILKSLKEDTGRSAILFPHGVLFRNEESSMREKLVRSDMLECVIGLGPNLFYNSPMEACIIICRKNKPANRRGQVLFINAVDEVERKNAQSYLEDKHIEKIASAYNKYETDNDFARVVSIRDIEDNNFSLSIPLYVKKTMPGAETDDRSLQERYESWRTHSEIMKLRYMKLSDMIGKEDENNE